MQRLLLSVLIAFSTCFTFAQCTKSTESIAELQLKIAPNEIQQLAPEISSSGTYVLNAITRRFGNPTRHVGSGIDHLQWDIAGGVLTYGMEEASFRTRDGQHIWLTDDRRRILTVLTTTGFEMASLPHPRMRAWLGDVYLKKDGSYHFVDSGSQFAEQRKSQKSNFFIEHPSGKYMMNYATNCMPTTILQNQPQGTVIGALKFSTSDAHASEEFSVVYSESERRLYLCSRKPLRYTLSN